MANAQTHLSYFHHDHAYIKKAWLHPQQNPTSELPPKCSVSNERGVTSLLPVCTERDTASYCINRMPPTRLIKQRMEAFELRERESLEISKGSAALASCNSKTILIVHVG